jgi:hypothetical protein
MASHCWHPKDSPAVDQGKPEICCYCGAIRRFIAAPAMGHGPHAPAVFANATQKILSGFTEECTKAPK